MQMIRQTLRSLVRHAGFTTVTVTTLALGIGASVAVFSLVSGVLLEQLPYPDPHRVVQVDHAAPGLALDSMGMSEALFHYYRENAETVEGLAMYNQTATTLTGDGAPERLQAALVTPSLFAVLGIRPLHGRTFAEEASAPGASPQVVLGHSLWQERFGGDPAAVGQMLRLDGSEHEVIGIMPETFSFPDRDVALWLVRQLDPEKARLGAFSDQGIARLRPGVSLERGQADLARLTTSLPDAFPEEPSAGILLASGFAPVMTTRLEEVVGRARDLLWVLLAAVGLILLIACANVANLFLVRVEERGTELAIRRALGIGRGRLVRTLLGESLALAALAGAIGLALAWAVVRLVVRLGPSTIPRLDQVGIDARVLAFAVAVTLASGLFFGLLPALRVSRTALAPSLKEGRSTSAGHSRLVLRNLLVVAQMALGLVLLVICGLVVRSTLALNRVEPGFRADGALGFRLSLPETDYPDAETRVRLIERAVLRLEALPGVGQVGAASYLPLSGTASGAGYSIEGQDRPEGTPPPVFMQTHVSPGYLEALDLPLVEGRFLTADDHRNRLGNVVISKSIADRVWPGESAVGKRLSNGDPENEPWQTVVGVAGDVHLTRLEDPATDLVYLPLLSQEGATRSRGIGRGAAFVLRTELGPTALTSAVRDTIAGLDRNLPVTRLQPLTELVKDARARLSFTVTVLLMAAAMALIIAAVGLYGVISYLVSQRQHEIGIRMALGAARHQIGDLVLRQGLSAAVVGAGIGLLLALFTTRLIGSLLFVVGTRDPMTFAVVPVVLLMVAALATLIPAWRAMGIEPIQALRHE